jgi:hypothetical protein
VPPWTFGVTELMLNLSARGLLVQTKKREAAQ